MYILLFVLHTDIMLYTYVQDKNCQNSQITEQASDKIVGNVILFAEEPSVSM